MQNMIPKTIWQTYKDPFDSLPQYAKDATQTWIDMNPDYQYKYMDDKEASSFILKEYGQEWYDIFINAPVGVMRGDIWRYLIINSYGGLYVDLDTICTKPLNEWLNNNNEMVICLDDDNETFVQYAFAGSPNNYVLQIVIEYIKNKIIFSNPTDKMFIHHVTGTMAWSDGIKKAIKYKDYVNNSHDLFYNFEILNKLFKEKNIYCHKDWNDFHNGGFIKHLVGHINWNNGEYVMWEDESQKYIDSLKST